MLIINNIIFWGFANSEYLYMLTNMYNKWKINWKKVLFDLVTPGCRAYRASTVLQQTMVFILSEFEPETLFKAWKDERWRK